MIKTFTNLSQESFDIQILNGEYAGRTIQVWGGKQIVLHYDVEFTVDENRKKDLRVDTLQ